MPVQTATLWMQFYRELREFTDFPSGRPIKWEITRTVEEVAYMGIHFGQVLYHGEPVTRSIISRMTLSQDRQRVYITLEPEPEEPCKSQR